jgi:hypothetical protein
MHVLTNSSRGIALAISILLLATAIACTNDSGPHHCSGGAGVYDPKTCQFIGAGPEVNTGTGSDESDAAAPDAAGPDAADATNAADAMEPADASDQ